MLKTAMPASRPIAMPDRPGHDAETEPAGSFTIVGVRYHVSTQAGKDAVSWPLFLSYRCAASIPEDAMPFGSLPDIDVQSSPPSSATHSEDDDWAEMDSGPLDAGTEAALAPLSEADFSRALREGLGAQSDRLLLDRWRVLRRVGGQADTALHFLSAQANPNWLGGLLRNLVAYGYDASTRPMTPPPLVLNRNCVYCAKAIDLSLDAAQADASGSDATSLWCALDTGRGSLASLTRAPGVQPGSFRLDASRSLTDSLFDAIPPGRRAIVCLPVLGYEGITHAVNAVHLADGGRYLVDGQGNRVYDARTFEHRRDLEAAYGTSKTGRDRGDEVHVSYFDTGPAPRWTRSA